MTEVGRLLRYAVPGGVFELVLGLWLFADAWSCDGAVGNCLLDTIRLADPSMALLLIAAAFPLGFIVAVFANELAWFLLRLYPEARVRGRIGTSRVLAIVERDRPHRHWLRATCLSMELAREGRQKRRQASEAIVELLLHMANKGEAYRTAVERVRSLADLMNSLLNLWVALTLAAVACTGVYGLTMRFDQNAADDSSAIYWFIGIALVTSIGVLGAGWFSSRVQERLLEIGALALFVSTLLWAILVVPHLDVTDSSRLFIYSSFTAITLLLLPLVSQAERRVAYITEVFVVAMVEASDEPALTNDGSDGEGHIEREDT